MFVNRWAGLCFLILGGDTILELSSMKDVFYAPVWNDRGLTSTQVGLSFTAYMIVQATGLSLSLYITDRYSKRILLPFGLIGVGLCGLYLATLPSFTGYLICFTTMTFFANMAYWPVLLKAVCLLGTKEGQGCTLGFLEAEHGVVDVIVVSGALFVLVQFGEGKVGIQTGLLFYTVIALVADIVACFIVGGDKAKGGEKTNANMEALKSIKHVSFCPNVWLASLGIFFACAVYCRLTYFIPFLRDIYTLPTALVDAYGITNQYALKMVDGPIDGMLADKVTKSPTVYLEWTFLTSTVAMLVFMQLPRQTMSVYIGMAATLGFGAIIFSQRVIFSAPVDEIGTPREYASSVVAFSCTVGYMPVMLACTLYGYLLDTDSGITGYSHVLSVIITFSLAGSICSITLVKRTKKQKLAAAAVGA